jgi:hypothetical protein
MQKTLNSTQHRPVLFFPGRQMTTNLDAIEHYSTYYNVYGKRVSDA